MSTIHYANETSMESLDGAIVAILGYGSQGHAHALNLRDSGADVVVGLRPGSAAIRDAEAEGLKVAPIAEAVRQASVVAVLLPDQAQGEVYRDEIEPGLVAGDMLLFAHGFNVHFGYIEPPEGVDVALVAPKAPGHRVREVFRQGAGTPGLVAVHHDATGRAQERALAYAHGIGCTRAGVIETTFREETETDLFGEQAVLCGGVSALVRTGFETLVEAGYQPEIAYFECLHELKLIVDLMYRGGLGAMWHSVSDTAEHGGYEGGSRIVTPEVEEEMRSMLQDIQKGDYARRWMDEYQRGGPEFGRRRAQEKDHPIEEVGKTLRTMMPFLEQDQKAESVTEASAGG